MNKNNIIKKFLEIYNDQEEYPSGSCCYYVKINNKLGVKIYYQNYAYRNRNNSYKRQMKYNKLGVAPKVYFKFEFLSNNKRYYCYLTENVELPSIGLFNGNIRKFKRKLKIYNIPTFDACKRNVGIKDGELILIDCDDYSTYKQVDWPY